MSRDDAIGDFLAANGFSWRDASPLAQDASFRRYFRLRGGAVLMDAPPPEDIGPFLRLTRHFASLGLSVPNIIAADQASGLIIEEDLGDSLFGPLFERMDMAPLFDAAIDALIVMQRAAPPPGLPAWDTAAMLATTLDSLFNWWWPAMHHEAAPDAARSDITEALIAMLAPIADGPFGLVHRDFFAGNLLWLPDRTGPNRVGIIDFQSAAIGHPAYDLVSLLQDARRDIPAALEDRAISRYLALRPDQDSEIFRTGYDICAAQRHLRVSCQWVRLALRDARPQYLVHGPRTWALLDRALAQPAAAPLAAALDRWIPADRRRNPPERAA